MLKVGSNVFVTGATGLIGGELLRTLVDHPVAKLWALVRPTHETDPATRLSERLSRSAAGPIGEFDDRLRAVAGDISHEQLGLSDEDAEEVRREADIIIHSAAETSFIRSMACRRTNISGSKRILEFAASCRRQPLLVYFSTAYVSGVVANACLTEHESLRSDNKHHNEYTRSKAVAEEMVRESGLPVLVVRPSVVLGAGLSDATFAKAILWFVPLLNALDAVPINPAGRPDVVPVQFVVDSVLELLQRRQLSHNTYHISAGASGSTSCDQLARVLDRIYERHAPLRLLSPQQWTRDVHRHFVKTPQQRKIFASLRSYLPFLNMNVSYDNARLRHELGDRFPCLTPLHEYFGDIVRVIAADAGAARLLRTGTA